jgi:transcriptional regulator with XRE-family HTH domain
LLFRARTPLFGGETDMTFGEIVADARKKANLSQKELAAKLRKEDGEPISPQYLNDIEHDRRNPPSAHLIDQVARILKVSSDVLYHAAGRVPADLARVPEEKIEAGYQAFRRRVKKTGS